MDAGRAAGMTVAGLRGVEADVPIADLAELAQLLLRSSGVLADRECGYTAADRARCTRCRVPGDQPS